MTQDELVAMAKRVFPEPKKVQGEVEAAVSSAARGDLSVPGLESLRPPGPPPAAASASMGLESMEFTNAQPANPLHKRLRDGADALEKVRTGRKTLTPNEQLGLEAIVLLFGRPALLVQDDDFGTPPSEWAQLEGKRAMIKGILPSIGRVELTGHHTFPWCGTAFLVGDGVLMTNKHVAQIFALQSGTSWRFMPGVTARIDYKEEYQRDKPNEFEVTKVLGVHPKYDLSLLQVSMTAGRKKSPKILSVASKAPKFTKDGELAVIGYPAFDSRNGRNEQLDIFKNIFDVKRLQPGKSTGLSQSPQILGHDASTLGGNSGSAVIDLETGSVMALHFGGQYLKGNVSVPLWKLTDDPLLKKHKVNFA